MGTDKKYLNMERPNYKNWMPKGMIWSLRIILLPMPQTSSAGKFFRTFSISLILKSGSPIVMPSALASLLRATAQPSLLLSTMTGLPFSSGRKTLSHEAKKLLQSARAYMDNYAEAYGEACGAG